MRFPWAVVAALLVACGSTDTGSGTVGPDGGTTGGGPPAQVTLEIVTAGSGLVRGAGNDCRGDCKVTMAAGSVVHLQAVADGGFAFSGWTGACSGVASCDLTVTDNVTTTATFVPQAPGKHRLAVALDGLGRVTSAPGGVDCPSVSCSFDYDSGTGVTLTAAAAPGWTFGGWTGGCSGTGDCTVKLDGDVQAHAQFNQLPPPPVQHRLTVVINGQGRVTSAPGGLDCSSGSCTVDFANGAVVTLTQAAGPNWTFGGWSNGCTGSGGCTVTLDHDVEVDAQFNPPPPPPATSHVIVALDGRGHVTGSGIDCGDGNTTCDVTVSAGSSVTLNAAADNGARFINWTGPCGGNASSCTFTAQGEERVGAVFQDVVTTLVVNDGTNVPVLAINSNDAFYSRYTNADGFSIWAVPKTGGTPRRVTSGYALYMVAADDYFYWTDGFSIYSVPTAGGSASLLASGSSIGRLALDSAGALYYPILSQYQRPGSVHRIQSRVDTTLVSNINPDQGIAVNGGWVYYSDRPADGHTYVNRAPTSPGGAGPQRIFTCPPPANTYFTVSGLKADPSFVYVRLSMGDLWAVSPANGNSVRLSAGNQADYNWVNFNDDVDANAGIVYWNWNQSKAADGIFSARFDGAQFTALDSDGSFSWYGPRVDDTAVFYWHNATLTRRLK